MYSFSLFVTALCMIFIYRALHPSAVVMRTGLNPENPELMRQPVMLFAKRARAALGLLIMVLVVSGSYRLPIEIGQMVTTAQERQLQLQQQRLAYRLAAEKRHTDAMIEALGGQERFLSYLSHRAERQFIQK